MPIFMFLLGPDAAAPQNLNFLQKTFGNNPMPMILLVFGVFYFLLIRPQQQKQKEHESWQKRVAVGDEVATTGGLVGKITHVTEDVLTVEVGDKVRVRVLRAHVTGPAPGARAAADKDKDKDKASA